MHFKYMHFIKN